jgi:ribosomal protein L11 methyltransferase
MPYLQLTLTTNLEIAELISDTLSDLGALSVTMQDAEDQPILEPAPGETPLWQAIKLTALFEETQNQSVLLENLKLFRPITALSFNILEDQDWVRVWQKDFKPMSFGKRLWICPTGYTPPNPAAINILLDPGLAFGTGTHPTTALCLEWLDENIRGNEYVIDYGCGSGILAIAALKLGCSQVLAVDNDPQAIQSTDSNARQNHIDPQQLSILLPPDMPAIQANVIVANILAQPLIQLAPLFKSMLKEGGKIALSGILADQAEMIINAYQAVGFQMSLPIQKQDWILIQGELAQRL